jgi:SNF family Na+-dependent transporter
MYARQAYMSKLGLLFCVPYTISWFVFAKPLIELETTLGQMTQSGPFVRFLNKDTCIVFETNNYVDF